MINVINLYGYHYNEKLLLRFFSASVFFGLILNFLGSLSGIIGVLLVLASVTTGFFGILIYLYFYSVNKYTKWLIFLLVYFIIIGNTYGNFNPQIRGGDFMWIFNQDLRYVMYFLIGSILATPRYLKYFHQIMRLIGILSIVAAFFGLLYFDFSSIEIVDRTNAWNFSYYCWWLSASSFTYWGYYAIIMNKEKLLGYGVLLSYFILGVLFLKRAAFINVIVLLFIANLLSSKYFIKYISRIFGIILLAFILLFVSYEILKLDLLVFVLNSIFDRFFAIDKLSEVDRIYEWKAYLSNTTYMQLVFGNGIGHYPIIQLYNNIPLKLNALHIGFYNIIFKGGIIYAIFYILLYFKIFKKFIKRSSLEKYDLLFLGISLSSLVSLLYEGSWGYTLVPFVISAPIFYTALNRSKWE